MYARQWCSSPDDAVQEAFVDFAKLPDSPIDSIAWLFKTTRYKAINQTRSETRRERHQREAMEIRDDWFIEDQDHRLELQDLEAELCNLTAIQREIVIAKVWGELSFAQISDLVNVSTTSAFRLYREALEQLAQKLTGETSSEMKMKNSGAQNGR